MSTTEYIIVTSTGPKYLLVSPDAAVETISFGTPTGSRRHTDTTTLVKAGRLREIGGRAINLLTRAVLLGQYRDTQCGLKAFRTEAAKRLKKPRRLTSISHHNSNASARATGSAGAAMAVMSTSAGVPALSASRSTGSALNCAWLSLVNP